MGTAPLKATCACHTSPRWNPAENSPSTRCAGRPNSINVSPPDRSGSGRTGCSSSSSMCVALSPTGRTGRVRPAGSARHRGRSSGPAADHPEGSQLHRQVQAQASHRFSACTMTVSGPFGQSLRCPTPGTPPSPPGSVRRGRRGAPGRRQTAGRWSVMGACQAHQPQPGAGLTRRQQGRHRASSAEFAKIRAPMQHEGRPYGEICNSRLAPLNAGATNRARRSHRQTQLQEVVNPGARA